MKAYQLVGWQKAAEFREVAVPEPGPGEVLIEIAGAGACHSDLHLMEWPAGSLPYALPFTLGHENAGYVAQLGAGVSGLSPRDPVLVYGPWGCGHCRNCRMGIENYCENAARSKASGGGLGADGGMASHMLVPAARLLLPLRSLEPADAAPLADAGLTAYHAVKRCIPSLPPGSTAVVIGAGGLGQMAIQYLRALTPARVVAVDTSPAKLALATELGADRAVRSADDAVGEIVELTRGIGADAVIDFVGNDATLRIGAKSARALGQLLLVGLGGGALPVSFFSVPRECTIATTYWGSIPELLEVIALAESRSVTARVELFPLDAAPEVYDRLRRGDVQGRAVLVPGRRGS